MIKLGLTPQTLRDYNLNDPTAHRTATGNPFAPGVSSQGAYSALDGWAEWTAEDWSGGIHNTTPDKGLWNSIATTNFGRKVMLPLAPIRLTEQFVDGFTTGTYEPKHCGTINVGTNYGGRLLLGPAHPTTGTFASSIAFLIEPQNTPAVNTTISFYMWMASGSFDCHLYTDVDGTFANATLLATATRITHSRSSASSACGQWVTFEFNNNYLTSLTPMWVSLDIYYSISPPSFAELELVSGSVTAGHILTTTDNTPAPLASYTNSNYIPLFSVNDTGIADNNTPFRRLCQPFNGKFYRSSWDGTNANIYVDDADNPAGLTSIGAPLPYTSPVYSMATWGNKLYFTHNNGTVHSINTSGTVALEGFSARLLAKHRGYLWRVSTGNVVSYSNDATTWQTVGTIYPTTGNSIFWMAGMGDIMYISTSHGIFYIAWGDLIQFLTDWGTSSTTATVGRYLVSVGDRLYSLVDEQTIYSIDNGHQITNIFANADYFLDLGRTPGAMTAIQDWLAVVIRHGPSEPPGNDIYLYKDATWHYLAALPTVKNAGLAWDDNNNRLIACSEDGQTFLYTLANLTTSFHRSSDCFFAKNGWIEYDKQYGGRVTLKKEWESITSSWELKSATGYDHYLLPTESTLAHSPIWAKLAPLSELFNEPTLASNTGTFIEEKRFTSSTLLLRRADEWIKIGTRLITHDKNSTPILDALALKYLPNVTDYDIFTLDIPVSDTQPLTSGALIPYTAAQQFAHLESLKAAETLVYYQDMKGDIYGCKVLARAYQPTSWDAELDASRAKIPYIYQLTLQQFEKYVPPLP